MLRPPSTVLRNRLYYTFKPLLPQGMRLAVRSWLAARKLRQVGDTWPVAPGSERAPEGWPGWPDGKRFALVLTHDVEGQAGLDRCSKLMELEKSLGFRSSFTLIPKGPYGITRELREEMTRDGFEVTVHDLYHNGKLFLTKKEFVRNAPEINRHLREWKAVGFRSGFMLHNLEWLHELDIEYDLSTFDTDPFEPQPHGQGTIFPFWVSRPVDRGRGTVDGGPVNESRHGYAELPYTLPQDSTLFLILGERHPDIWCQKLDWVAKHGGMALVNVHPDYMAFDEAKSSNRCYPAALYRDFLEYARKRHADSFWHPLARDVARHVARTRLMEWKIKYSPLHL